MLAALWLSAGTLSAEQFGLFTYRVVGETIEITDYPTTEVGAVEIPAEIDGKPVTSIGDDAFVNCARLTSISIPESVTSISSHAFHYCFSLTTIEVDTLNSSFSHLDGVLFDYNRTALIRLPAGKTGAYSIPDGVTEIGSFAFVLSPLTTVIFLGDAPSAINSFGWGTTFVYLRGSSGFPSPRLRPTIMLDAVHSPSGLWLLANGLPVETDLHEDLNGDGVTLLMAYALNLNPNLNLRSRFPKPVLDEDHLRMFFFAAAGDISYTVQTATDLKNWTAEGVTLSELSGGGRWASVP